MNIQIGIVSAGYYLPPGKKRVTDIFRDEKIPEERLAANIDFQKDIGIAAVHIAAEETATGIALKAVNKALEKAALDPKEIDLIIDFTSIPEDHPAPTWSAAGSIQREIGAINAFATAINTGGCASYHVALKSACAFMSANDHIEIALLFAGDKVPADNHVYYPITVICDGGSAVILKKNHDRNVILAVETVTVGKLHDVWYIPGFRYRDPENPNDSQWLHMTSDIEKFNREVIPINLFMFRRVMRSAMKKVGLKPDDIDYYIYPTFSTWDQKSFCEGLRIPPAKVYRDGLKRHGHLQETDMVLNFVDATEERRIRENDIVMLTTNGAGFAWGPALIKV